MTPTKEQINEAVFHSARLGEGSMPPLYEALRVLGIAYRAKCAEVEELRTSKRELIEHCAAIAVEYMESIDRWEGTVADSAYLRLHIIDKALEGKE